MGGCVVVLAYLSASSGSFHDLCINTGVRTAVELDKSFRMTPMPEPTEQEGLHAHSRPHRR